MALPQTVGFKAEAVGEGVWCVCTVEEVDDDYVIVSFDGWNAEWNCRVCDPQEVRDRILPFPMSTLFDTTVKDICAINTFEKLLNILFSEVY